MIKFGFAGLAATVVDYALRLCIRKIAPDLVAVSAGYALGTVVSYVLSILYIFKHRNVTDKRLEFTIFFVLSIIGWGLTVLVVSVSIMIMNSVAWAGDILSFTHNWVQKIPNMRPSIEDTAFIVARILGTVLVFFFNFFSRKVLLFRKPKGV